LNGSKKENCKEKNSKKICCEKNNKKEKEIIFFKNYFLFLLKFLNFINLNLRWQKKE
jgi:hypothetical protein